METVKNILLLTIDIIVTIFGKNPKNGGIPAILIKIIIKVKLLIFLNFEFVIVWNKKLVLLFFITLVAE